MSFDSLLKLIPAYVSDLLSLLSSPKAFFAGRDLNDRKILVQALLFLFNSTLIAYVLRVPVLGEAEAYWQAAIVTVVLYTPTAVVLGAVAFVCCRLVGGQGGLPGHVTIFSYIAGISVLILALAQLVAKGIVKLRLPNQFALYQDYMRRLFGDLGGLDDPRFADLAASQELLIAVLVLVLGLLLIGAWLIWAWRAFGDWNQLAAPRSAAALALFLLAGYPVSVALGYAQAAAGVSLF
ncbi:MAG: hypothetical protein V3U63_11140 [Gemmatimonadota bacterium]